MLFFSADKDAFFIRAGEIKKVPDEKDLMYGISFPAVLPQGKDEETGMIKIIATKEDLPITVAGELSGYGTYETGYESLMKELIDIPRSMIEEIELSYVITK